MFVACLFLLLASPVIFLAIKGIFVILIEGPAAEGQAVTPKDSTNSDNSAIYSPNSITLSLLGEFLGLDGDDMRPWDPDLSEFMNDIDGDADAATMLGTAGQFDLCHERSDEKFAGIELNDTAQHLKKSPPPREE
jgi:hypothetical protein